MRNWIYKAERFFDHQDPDAMDGWDAYAPYSDQKSVGDHIKDGSQGSRFLSASTSPSVSGQKHCLGSYNRKSIEGVKKTLPRRRNLLLIDWSALDTKTYDCSDKTLLTPEVAAQTHLIPDSRAVTNASADSEIVIQDNISSKAGRVVPSILSDVLCALEQQKMLSLKNPKEHFRAVHYRQMTERIEALKQKIEQGNRSLEAIYNTYLKFQSETLGGEFDRLSQLLLDYDAELQMLQSQREVLIQDGIPEEEHTPSLDCIGTVMECINNAIYRDGAEVLLSKISEIDFNDIEQRFIKAYYNEMISMDDTAGELGFDEKDRVRIAARYSWRNYPKDF